MQKPQKSILALLLLAGCAIVPRHAAPPTEATVTAQVPDPSILTRRCYIVTETMSDGSAPLDTESRWLRKICDRYIAPKRPAPTLISLTQPPVLRAEN